MEVDSYCFEFSYASNNAGPPRVPCQLIYTKLLRHLLLLLGQTPADANDQLRSHIDGERQDEHDEFEC